MVTAHIVNNVVMDYAHHTVVFTAGVVFGIVVAPFFKNILSRYKAH